MELFRKALHLKPFEPFVIRLVNGQSVTVADPDLVAIGTRHIVVLGEEEGMDDFECDMIVLLDKPNK